MVGSLKTRDEDIVYSYIEIYSSESVYGLTTHKEYKGTTAGYKGTFSYNKLIQFLIWMVTDPKKAFIMGGTYRIPVLAGLQAADFIDDMRRDGGPSVSAIENLFHLSVGLI